MALSFYHNNHTISHSLIQDTHEVQIACGQVTHSVSCDNHSPRVTHDHLYSVEVEAWGQLNVADARFDFGEHVEVAGLVLLNFIPQNIKMDAKSGQWLHIWGVKSLYNG